MHVLNNEEASVLSESHLSVGEIWCACTSCLCCVFGPSKQLWCRAPPS